MILLNLNLNVGIRCCEQVQETAMTTKSSRVTIEVREHPSTTLAHPCWLAIVTTARGLCYFCTHAGDQPTEEHVRQAWQEDHKAFDPYYS